MARKYTVTETNSNTGESKAVLSKVSQQEFDSWFARNRAAIVSWRVTRFDNAAKELKVVRAPGATFVAA